MAEHAPLPPALAAAVARIHAALPPPTPGSHVALAFDRDRPGFLATLLAVWTRGHAVALPVNARRAAVAPVLARPEVVLLAHDTGAGLGLDVSKLLATDAAAPDAPALRVTGDITVHEDGAHASTGARLTALVADVAAAMRLPRGALVWNGFSAGAPGGLVPGVLVPFLAGAATTDDVRAAHALVAPAPLLRRLARAGLGATRLVVTDQPLDRGTGAAIAANGVRTVTARLAPPRDRRCVELEHTLLAQDGVDDAAVEPLGDEGFVCVVATARGREQFRQVLGPRVLLRCVPELPRDPDGFIGRATVLRALDRLPDGSPAVHGLQLETVDGDAHRCRVQVPLGFAGFDGHFPTYPVLSGAVQLHELVLPALRMALGRPCRITAFHDLKFLARIAPGDTVDVVVRPAAARAVEFEILRGATKCSTGRALLAEANAEAAR